MAIEIELKLTIDPAHVARFRHHSVLASMALSKPRRHKLHNVYFDTSDQDLQRAGMTLRLRRMNGNWIQTVKSGGGAEAGLHQRNEWEWPVCGGEPELASIASDFKLLTPKLLARLRPLFVTDYWRTIWQLRTAQGAEIELVLDQGDVHAGDARQPISEIELELKTGEAASLFEVALAIQEHVPLWVEDKSKAQRGYMLCSGKTSLPCKAQHVPLTPEMPVAEAFQHIARECLSQLQGNVVELGQDPEYLHQARVAVRRLRSVLGVFEAVFPEAYVSVVEELRWLMGCLGPARDWDVFVTQTLPHIAEQLSDNRALAQLQADAAKFRDTCRQAALEAVLSQRYTRLVLTLGLQLARQAELPGIPIVLGGLTTQTLSWQHKCVRRKGRLHAALNTAERHALRIAAKKLRYTAEFFSGIYPPKRVRLYLEALAALQDVLGILNDASVTQRLLADLSAQRGQAAGIVIGWTACSNGVNLQKLRYAWRNFMRQKVFWK
ncbi:CYTH and CHAD domain-containing protein [Candidatus Nitrotoga sp. AM1P]|uniref:CYTH and CHAD domain-containing protein n=1 Tax=Candidatus Nitrotoga sp. AM1P TaxID=2559597 RepID=UPI0010B9AB8E|nr:CYTH and CHAD domain-containing protein [Candidatus Nitrotoga sp. AM1P]BBJ23119.1 inorganic triphosphatase [Candidatus Nitrotoga sp. AM1P]